MSRVGGRARGGALNKTSKKDDEEKFKCTPQSSQYRVIIAVPLYLKDFSEEEKLGYI